MTAHIFPLFYLHIITKDFSPYYHWLNCFLDCYTISIYIIYITLCIINTFICIFIMCTILQVILRPFKNKYISSD